MFAKFMIFEKVCMLMKNFTVKLKEKKLLMMIQM